MSPEGQASAADIIAALLKAAFEGWLAAQQHLEELRLAALERARENQAKVQ